MKTQIFLAAFLIITCYAVQAQNLIQNGDFENWKRTGANPAFWLSNNKGNVVFEYAKDKKQGNILRLKEIDSAGSKARRFQNTTDIAILSAGNYEVTFKVKGNVGLRAVVLARKGENPSTSKQSPSNHPAAVNSFPSGTMVDEWTDVFTTIEIPETAAFSSDYRLHISWSHHNASAPACDFYIDDVKVVLIK